MSAWTRRLRDGKAVAKIVPPCLRIPWWKGLGADSEEKHEPVRDIDTVAVVNGLKVLDPKRPIREADVGRSPTLSYLPPPDVQKTRVFGTLLSRSAVRWIQHVFCADRRGGFRNTMRVDRRKKEGSSTLPAKAAFNEEKESIPNLFPPGSRGPRPERCKPGRCV